MDRKIAKEFKISTNFLKTNPYLICINAGKGNITICIEKSEYVRNQILSSYFSIFDKTKVFFQLHPSLLQIVSVFHHLFLVFSKCSRGDLHHR